MAGWLAGGCQKGNCLLYGYLLLQFSSVENLWKKISAVKLSIKVTPIVLVTPSTVYKIRIWRFDDQLYQYKKWAYNLDFDF